MISSVCLPTSRPFNLVTDLPNSNKWGAKGHVLVKGPWASLMEHPKMDFRPNCSLKIPSSCKRGRLVEWVEKASFSYVINIIPKRLSKIVVPEKHFILKDIPFYEEAREVDVKTLQERLEQREKKRQEGKLRKFPGEKGRGSSSAARPPAKKKKRLLQKRSSSLRLDPRDPRTHPSKPEPESIALEVINESKEEEDMNDLRAEFKEKHRKRLHEAIDMVPPPAKKACSERAQEEPAREVPPIVVSPSDVAGPSRAPAAKKEAGRKKVGRKEAGPTTGKAYGDVVPVDEVSDKKNTPTLASPPS
ncbi:hypothetical protein CK203_006551 [Vitis vinifera]|uniref:Uncharacterized protein n=1 Tax=Vitis vinifera TaxID=29760 RepID=A0A438KBH5_VITVI|nr:hypothetical protein CK203_006551 [Vitis vinifera]